MTIAERKQKLDEINDLLQTSGYVYTFAQSGASINFMPPPPGTSMNCESVARIFMRLAMDMGIDNLQAMHFKDQRAPGGYFVLDGNGKYRALGNRPIVEDMTFRGWDFSHHYRVKDVTTGTIYDPTFGTSSANDGNPPGILLTSETLDRKSNALTSIYGERYRVVRHGLKITCTEISKNAVSQMYLVGDLDFHAKPMSGLERVVVATA